MRAPRSRFGTQLAVAAGILLGGGCGSDLLSNLLDNPRSTLNLALLDADPATAHFESDANDLFTQAEPIETTDQPLIIRGAIAGPTDVDVFDLGPVEAGDRILADIALDDTLAGALALFDAGGASLLINDHRNVYLGRVEPFIDVVAPRASPACYLAVTATPGFASSGNYALGVSKTSGADPPAKRPDVVLLVFEGGRRVVIGGRAPVQVGVFDTGDISPSFSGDTGLIEEEIVARVREDYTGFNVDILSTSEGSRFEPGMTRIFFGAFDPGLLGVADGVDEFNATAGQQAIVFTNTFAAFLPLDPTVEEISQAIANVASHEIGHLLGMIHTGDPAGIMDVSASLNELLNDQRFTRSPIFGGVFPLGEQDAMQYLLSTVGGDPLAVARKSLHTDRRKPLDSEGEKRRPARKAWRFSTCTLSEPSVPWSN